MKYILYTDKLLEKEIEDAVDAEIESNNKYCLKILKEAQEECVFDFDCFWTANSDVSVEFSIEEMLENPLKNDSITLKDLYLHFKDEAENISFERVSDSYGGNRLVCKSQNTPLAFALNEKKLKQGLSNGFSGISYAKIYLDGGYFDEERDIKKHNIIYQLLTELLGEKINSLHFEYDEQDSVTCNILTSSEEDIRLPNLGFQYVVKKGSGW